MRDETVPTDPNFIQKFIEENRIIKKAPRVFTYKGEPVSIDPAVVKAYEQMVGTYERMSDKAFEPGQVNFVSGPARAAITKAERRLRQKIKEAYPGISEQNVRLTEGILAGTAEGKTETIFSRGQEVTYTTPDMPGTFPHLKNLEFNTISLYLFRRIMVLEVT